MRYIPGVGLWRGKVQRLTWCPIVTRQLAVESKGAGLTHRRVTVQVDELAVTVPISDVADAKFWRDRFPDVRGTTTREIRDALTNIIEDQAAELPITPVFAHWSTWGRLILPPIDTLPPGYGATAGESAAFAALLTATVAAPRVALAMGAAVGGLYVKPLASQPHVWHAYGRGRQGKSTTLYAAASVFGCPGDSPGSCGTGVILPWNTTGQGPGTWLRGLGVLPGFRDDLGAAGYKPAERSKLVFQMTQGATRDSATRSGEHRTSPGSWHGVVISTGNDRVSAGITNEGIAARLVELTAPMTPTPQVADAIEAAARDGYGHGLAAIASERGWTPAQFRAARDAACVELDVAVGGVARTHGLHVALAVAGARQLAELFGVPEFATATVTAARQVLDEVSAALTDRGAHPGDRLLAAVVEDMASRQGAYPTRAAVAVNRPGPGDRGELVGYDLTGDEEPGDVAVLPRQLREIARRVDIEDHDVALIDLEQTGRLRRGDTRHLQRQLRVAGRVVRCYVLHLPTDDEQVPATLPDPEPSAPSAPTPPQTPPLRLVKPCERCSTDGEWCGRGETASKSAECVRCGQGTVLRSLCGTARHAHTPPPAQPSSDSSAPAARTDSTAPSGTATTNRSAGRKAAGERIDRSDELANVTRVIRDRHPGASVEHIAAALDAWHTATKGLAFVSYPGEVGVAALARLVATHPTMKLPQRLAPDGPVATITESGRLHRYTEWLTPGLDLTGRSVTSLDVNAQYLAAAVSTELGDGEPTTYTRPRGGLDSFVRLPGYVLLDQNLDTEHPALGILAAGTWLAMPTVNYLVTNRDLDVPVDQVVVWHEHGRRLKTWAAQFSHALAELPAGRDEPTTYARTLVKAVYVAHLGGMLRSERWNALPRPDWSDMVVTQAEANKVRAIDKATGAGETVIGSWRDAAWFASDTAPHTPAGITLSTQPGKWKIERHAEGDELADAYSSGSPSVFRDALAAAHRARIEQ